MPRKPPPPRIPEWHDPSMLADMAEAFYRQRLGPVDVARMVAKDDDGGVKLRGRSAAYVELCADFMRVLRDEFRFLALLDRPTKPREDV